MRLACLECLHVDELENSRRTILLVFDEVDKRYDRLTGKGTMIKLLFCRELSFKFAGYFEQQGLHKSQQFNIFASGMVSPLDNEESETMNVCSRLCGHSSTGTLEMRFLSSHSGGSHMTKP